MKGEREDGVKEFGRGTRKGHVIRTAVLCSKLSFIVHSINMLLKLNFPVVTLNILTYRPLGPKLIL